MKGTGDLKQVGVTPQANEQLRELVENHAYFDAEQDVYRLAVAVALALEKRVNDKLMDQETPVKWRVADDLAEPGSRGTRLDDPDRTLARMVAVCAPEYADEPYRYSQYLASIGINYLHTRLFERGMNLFDALEVVHGRRSGDEHDLPNDL